MQAQARAQLLTTADSLAGRTGALFTIRKDAGKIRIFALRPPEPLSKFKTLLLRSSASASAAAAADGTGAERLGSREARRAPAAERVGPYVLKVVPFVKYGTVDAPDGDAEAGARAAPIAPKAGVADTGVASAAGAGTEAPACAGAEASVADASAGAGASGSAGAGAAPQAARPRGPFVAYVGALVPPPEAVRLVSPLGEDIAAMSSAERNKHLLFAQAFTAVPAWHFDPILVPTVPIGEENKGREMLAKLGWGGAGLGRSGRGALEPVEIVVRPERGGLPKSA
jgi:hypothetical protein